MNGEELKKKLRCADLALAACRKRQSPRTGFVHYFSQDELATDVISIYENFSFILALFRNKTGESISEGKGLLDRLLNFQTADGNFPIYLHDYPNGWDYQLPLKIAPVLIYLLREFTPVLGISLKERIERALHQGLQKVEQGKTLSPLGEICHNACKGIVSSIPFEPKTPEEWFDWVVSRQLLGLEIGPIPYHAKLQYLRADQRVQEKGEVRPTPLEWLLAEREGFDERLSRDHPHQIYTALFLPHSEKGDESNFLERKEGEGVEILWKGKKLHSLFLPRGELIQIGEGGAPERGDLFEVEAFADLDTKMTINGERGTVFKLGDWVEIEAAPLKIALRFHLIEGTGEFCGHISRANRPNQISCKGPLLYETYDWRVALRTLRKSSPCTLQIEKKIIDSLV